jgi:hypothetical protein
VLGVASLITILCVALFFAAVRNDASIEGQLGTVNAQVDSVAFDRTIIHFQTPDGITHSPATGVLYPDGLSVGEVIRIQYDIGNTELTRVAGRSAELTLLPLGSTIGFTWLVAAPLLWWIRRTNQRAKTAKEPAQVSGS